MTKEYKMLEARIANLERAFLQAQNNNVAFIEKADRVPGTEKTIEELRETTPQKFSKKAYVGDTSVSFPYTDGVVSANISGGKQCNVSITSNEIIVQFDALEEEATVSISII